MVFKIILIIIALVMLCGMVADESRYNKRTYCIGFVACIIARAILEVVLQHCCHRERRSRTERLFLYHNIYLHSMVFLSNEFSNSAKSKLLSIYPCRMVSM